MIVLLRPVETRRIKIRRLAAADNSRQDYFRVSVETRPLCMLYPGLRRFEYYVLHYNRAHCNERPVYVNYYTMCITDLQCSRIAINIGCAWA